MAQQIPLIKAKDVLGVSYYLVLGGIYCYFGSSPFLVDMYAENHILHNRLVQGLAGGNKLFLQYTKAEIIEMHGKIPKPFIYRCKF